VKVPYENVPQAQVHKGFYNAYLAVRTQVRNLFDLAQTRCESRWNVLITGHSVGAALSVRGSLDLVNRTSKPMALYNFGCPRVGNDAFVSFQTRNVREIWRFTNNRDPVPHVPLRVMGFIHEPTEIWSKNGQYIRCSSGEDPSCSNSVIITNPIDHGEYMEVKIWDGISSGCYLNLGDERAWKNVLNDMNQ